MWYYIPKQRDLFWFSITTYLAIILDKLTRVSPKKLVMSRLFICSLFSWISSFFSSWSLEGLSTFGTALSKYSLDAEMLNNIVRTKNDNYRFYRDVVKHILYNPKKKRKQRMQKKENNAYLLGKAIQESRPSWSLWSDSGFFLYYYSLCSCYFRVYNFVMMVIVWLLLHLYKLHDRTAKVEKCLHWWAHASINWPIMKMWVSNSSFFIWYNKHFTRRYDYRVKVSRLRIVFITRFL